jgi:hypothetical protein
MPSLYEPYPFDIEASRVTWDDMIKRYGDLAILRQPGLPDRWCSYCNARFSAEERLGGASNPVDRKVLISALTPDTGELLDPEPSERDVLVTLELNDDGSPVMQNGVPVVDEIIKIYAPPGRVGPSRVELYWRMQVRA